MLVNPPPGHYWIAVDQVRVPASGVEVAFRDTVFRAEDGTVNVADDSARSSNGERTALIEVHVLSRLLEGSALIAENGVIEHADGRQGGPDCDSAGGTRPCRAVWAGGTEGPL